ncbi:MULTISPECIES: dihydroorotase [unclassified Blastococcus]
MRADLVLRNARVVLPDAVVPRSGVVVRDGKITAIAADVDLPDADEVIDCGDRPLLPGIVDPHVHLGGSTPYIEICRSESVTAAVGGVTTLMQYKRSATSLLETFPAERQIAAENSSFDTGFHFILNNMEQVYEIPDYAREFGVVSFKFYMGGYSKGNPIGLVSVDDAILYEAMARIRDLGPYAWCMVHAEDHALVEHLTAKVKATGAEDLAAYTASRPHFVEEQDVLRAIWLAELQGSPLYVPHTTIGAAVAASETAARSGLRVKLETCPHYLALTYDDVRLAKQGAGVGKVAPALRDDAEREALWAGLANGTIKTIGSDHVPIVKTGAALWEEKPGFAGLATSLPVVLTEGVAKGRIDLLKVAEVMCRNPAATFGIADKGSIAVGMDADLVLVDMETEKVVAPETTRSLYTSAFEEMPLVGWPVLTVRRGEIQLRDGEVTVVPGSGRILTPQPAPTAA